MITSIVLAGLLSSPAAVAPADYSVSWSAPKTYVTGKKYEVEVELTIADGGVTVPATMLSAAAFRVNGEPLSGGTGGADLTLPAGAKLTLEYDLAPHLDVEADFSLSLVGSERQQQVEVMRAAPEGLVFWGEGAVPVEELTKYRVLLRTNHGDMLLETWPDVAPNHVRNFLDLAYTGYFDGTPFHRVLPGFMIQGGNAMLAGGAPPPRTVKAEFNERKHVRGVLSAARTDDPNSASSQFFIMHGNAPGLDGEYSAYGKLVRGEEALDALATAPTKANPVGERSVPIDPLVLEDATVVLAEEE